MAVSTVQSTPDSEKLSDHVRKKACQVDHVAGGLVGLAGVDR